MNTENTPQKSEDKLERFLELTEELRELMKDVIDAGSQRLQVEVQDLLLRDRVLIGLAFKIYASLESLTEDARNARSEAVHHLKTVVEAFIYFQWVGQDTGEERAKLVLAKVCRNKMLFIEKNSDSLDQSDYDLWKKAFHEYTRGLESAWKAFKKYNVDRLARDVGRELEQWYDRVYRFACEPAHMSDLPEYMPLPRGPIQAGHPQIHRLRVHVALDYGLQIGCDLLKNINDIYALGLDKNISELKARLDAVRTLKVV